MKELTIDKQDYRSGGSVFRRTAVRGIIRQNGKYLMIHGKYGDYKFPGGGQEAGETLEQTLLREVREETGYQVKKASICPGILVHERRKGDPEDLMEMESYYYFCQVETQAGQQELDPYEAEYEYQVRWMNLEEAAEKNGRGGKEQTPWMEREAMVMRALLEDRTEKAEKPFFPEMDHKSSGEKE